MANQRILVAAKVLIEATILGLLPRLVHKTQQNWSMEDSVDDLDYED